MLTARKGTEDAEVNGVEPKEYALLAGNFSNSALGTLEQKDEWISDCGGVLEILAIQSNSLMLEGKAPPAKLCPLRAPHIEYPFSAKVPFPCRQSLCHSII